LDRSEVRGRKAKKEREIERGKKTYVVIKGGAIKDPQGVGESSVKRKNNCKEEKEV